MLKYYSIKENKAFKVEKYVAVIIVGEQTSLFYTIRWTLGLLKITEVRDRDVLN
jgi:hypothetical protein